MLIDSMDNCYLLKQSFWTVYWLNMCECVALYIKALSQSNLCKIVVTRLRLPLNALGFSWSNTAALNKANVTWKQDKKWSLID